MQANEAYMTPFGSEHKTKQNKKQKNKKNLKKKKKKKDKNTKLSRPTQMLLWKETDTHSST